MTTHNLPPTELGLDARAALCQRRYPSELLAALDALDAAALRAEPWAALLHGRQLCRLHSRFAEATALIDDALAGFRAAGDGEGELWALAEWLVMRYHNGAYAAGQAAAAAALARPMPAYLRAEIHFGQFLCLIGAVQPRTAVAAGEAALAVLDTEPDAWLQRIGRIQMLRNIAAGYHYLGQVCRAVAAAEQAATLAQAHPDTADMRPWCYYELGLAYWRHGRLSTAAELLGQARRLAEDWQHRELWRWAVAAQGHVLRDHDRLEAALAAYQLANCWGEDPEGPAFIQLRQGRLAEARWSCETLLSHQGEGPHGDALLLLGLIELKSNQPAAALDLLDRASTEYAGAGLHYHQATVQLYRAAAGMALQRTELIEHGLRGYLAYAVREQLLTCGWWMPDLIEPLLIYASRYQIEPAWAERLLAERFVIAPPASPIVSPSHEHTELEIARRMQLSLLPAQPPLMPDLDIAAIIEPAAEIGGDFVGYFPRGAEPASGVRRQIGLAVGDISGKGLGAALLLSGAVVALNTVAATGAAPAHVARALHEALHPYTSRSRMTIAFCYALLTQQPGGWAAQLAGAGAVTPLLRRADGTCSWIETSGFPLGTFVAAHWREIAIDLAPGDILLLFSDGIVEAMDAGRMMFGFDRLAEVVRQIEPTADAQTVVRTVVGAIRTHSRAIEPHDDITLIAVRVLSGASNTRSL